MRQKILSILALAALTLLPQGVWADQISGDATVQDFGSSSATSWMVSDTNKGLANKVKTGSTVTLDGIVMTFGGNDDSWDYQDKSGTGLITNMPSTGNSAATVVTAIADGTAIPAYGSVYTFVPSATGYLTIYGSEANANNIFFGKVEDGKASGTITYTKNSNATCRNYWVESGNTYFFFQGAKASNLTSYRYTFKGIAFTKKAISDIEEVASGCKVWNFIEEPTVWRGRTSLGTYDGLTLTGDVTFEEGNGRYQINATGKSISFKVNTNGYLVIHGKAGATKKSVGLTIGTAAEKGILTGTNGYVYSEYITASEETLIKIKYIDATVNIHSISWIPDGSDQDNATKSVTLDSKGYATYYPRYNVTIPDDTNLTGVYYLKGKDDGNKVISGEITSSIPGTTAVFLVGEANSTITFSHEDETSLNAYSDGNDAAATSGYRDQKLHGSYKSDLTLEGESSSSYIYYGYVKNSGQFGRVTADVVIPEGKCYLRLSSGGTARDVLDLDFSESETTGISNVNRETINNNRYFNLSGQRVAQPTKGLYIVNGKKIVIK